MRQGYAADGNIQCQVRAGPRQETVPLPHDCIVRAGSARFYLSQNVVDEIVAMNLGIIIGTHCAARKT